MQGTKQTQGFTLVELMIVVALIGVLTSIAIPGFQRFQMNSKRAEAYTNLLTLAKSQKAYYSEWNQYVAVLPEPSNTLGIDPGSQKRSGEALVDAFAMLGWAPTGGVYFDYDTCAAGGSVACACTCPSCFTATAWGDLDDDGGMSGYMYFQPDANGATCATMIGGFGPPLVDGQQLLQTPGWNGSTDDF
jgi:prepilin-type N-terminal cleavage/methylation domain-containing protein